MTLVDGKWTVAEARFRGEMYHARSTAVETSAWLLVDSVGGWLDRVREVRVICRLQPGHSSQDHLFDRTIAEIAQIVEGRLFATATEIRKAAGSATRRNGEYSIEIEASLSYQDVPAELEPAAEVIRSRVAAKEAAKRRRARARFVARLGIHRGEDGAYRVTTADSHGRGHWVNSISGRYWYCESLTRDSGADYVGISGPSGGYATEAEAAAALAAVRAHYA